MKVALVIENNGEYLAKVEESLESVWDDTKKAERHTTDTYEVKRVVYRHHGDGEDEGFEVWEETQAQPGWENPRQFYIVEREVQS